MAVEVDQGLLNFAEATSLRAAVTTVGCRIPSFDSDQTDWTVVIGEFVLRWLDIYVDEVEWPARQMAIRRRRDNILDSFVIGCNEFAGRTRKPAKACWLRGSGRDRVVGLAWVDLWKVNLAM